MREFAQYEMRKTKCPVCGCRNKIFTSLVDKMTKEKVGYTITCCNCGYVGNFFKDHTKNGMNPPYTNVEPAFQRCFQPSFCPKKDCALYGTSCSKLMTGCYGDCVNCTDMNCNDGCCNDSEHENDSNNKNILENKVSVHIHNTPRFL